MESRYETMILCPEKIIIVGSEKCQNTGALFLHFEAKKFKP
jgi:hypothetical protein